MDTIKLLGALVTGANINELHEMIREAIATNQKWIIANHNLHSLYLFQSDAKLQEFFSKVKIAHVDGMSIIALSKLTKSPLRRDQRVTYVDWISPLIDEIMQMDCRLFFVGGKPGIVEIAEGILKKSYPGLKIKVHHGHFDNNPESHDNKKLLESINEFSPHILMVGMGMPRQEYWILDNLHNLQTNVILPVGACMDYVAGAVPTPPRLLGKLGLEWFFRLITEPRRLWRRYLIEPLFLIKLIFIKFIRKR